MKKLIYLLPVVGILLGCSTHNNSPVVYQTVNKSGPFITVNTKRDTLLLGDTISLTFNLTNPVTLDNGSLINIEKVNSSNFSYYLNKYDTILKMFVYAPLIVEQNLSYLPYKGIFSFNTRLTTLIGSTIRFVPQDTGVYVLSIGRYQNIVCTSKESKNIAQINLYPDFDVPNINEYLLERYPAGRLGFAARKTQEFSPYFCFYVKKQ
jgi:hypothetical protein